MIKIVFAAAAIVAAAPVLVGSTPAQAQELKVAQGVDVQIGRDRDERVIRRDRDLSVGVGPGGVRVGPRRERCRTVTTTVRRDDGTRVKRTEERCG